MSTQIPPQSHMPDGHESLPAHDATTTSAATPVDLAMSDLLEMRNARVRVAGRQAGPLRLASGRSRGLRSMGPLRARSLGLLVVALAAAQAASCSCRGCGARDDRPSVLLVTLDTTRRDRLGAYGSRLGLTPRIDALAGEGVTFVDARTRVPVTAPSHASILTGLDVRSHGVRENGTFALDDSALTLAEVLGGRGYRTAAFVSSFVLDSRFGLDQGFDLYDDDLGEPRGRTRSWQGHEVDRWERPGNAVTDAAIGWIGATGRKGPFLAWLHYYDPHEPYVPHAGQARHAHPYDDEVAFVDSQLGRVLDALEDMGILAGTLVVVASDHGESLGEHGIEGHGCDLYDHAMRAVLVMRLPGVLPAGARCSGRAFLEDVGATILDVLGIGGSGFPGGSLAPMWSGGGGASGPQYMETIQPAVRGKGPSLAGLLEGRWKLVVRRGPSGPELYDLEEDPGEETDLAAGQAERVEAMERTLDEILDAAPASTPGRAVGPDEETLGKLEALGYVR
jgi:arylsulfatase A-like enzyme